MLDRETSDLIRRLNEISDREPKGSVSEIGYTCALVGAAAAYRECLNANTMRQRLVNLAIAERAMGVAFALAAGNPFSEDHTYLVNAGATVLSLAANGPDAQRKIKRIG